jgi:DNA polymerase III epsilon subunit-like protein
MPPLANSTVAAYREKAIAWAQETLADKSAVILDTETTGLDNTAEIIEIAIINTHGNSLLNTLVKPKGKIPIEAYEIHGIGAATVKNASTWPDIDHQVSEIIHNASRVVIYNAAYDTRLIRQTRRLYNLPPWEISPQHYQCAMKRYAQFFGDWRGHQRGFRWQPLQGGNHRALGDCLATLNVIQKMAVANLRGETL